MSNSGDKKKELFMSALQDKKIPVLTLDNKWYRLLGELERETVKEWEEQLNILLKRQGKLNTEVKDIKKLKKKLMQEIVSMMDDSSQSAGVKKKIDDNKRLIEECNEKIDSYKDELLDLPREIEKINFKLMLMTMEYCYEEMQENTRAINDTAKWVTQIRIELKKRLIHKQEMEQKNHEIYSYMHDIFGADVVNLFDMKYNPEEQRPKIPLKEKQEEKQ